MRNLLTAASFSKPVPDEPSFNDCKPQSNKVKAINEEIFNIMNGLVPNQRVGMLKLQRQKFVIKMLHGNIVSWQD